jgi:uncharacterized repeat protein (TIGR02543 family)
MKKLIKQSGIMALLTLMVIMAACNMEMLGMVPKPPLNNTADNGQPVSGGNPGTGGGGQTTPSSNANIRAVSGDGTNMLYGLYIAGYPGYDNGTPKATAEGFEGSDVTLGGNRTINQTANNSKIVVIVEDTKVSKVEFGINDNNATTMTDNNPPSAWTTLERNNDFTTPDTTNKRWIGTLTTAPPSSSGLRGVYVRITAEDGTEQVYRYVQYVSTSAAAANQAVRGELTTLSIGGVSVIANGNVQSGKSKGTFAGWWNKTVAPDFVPGEVTISAAQAASCSVNATFAMSTDYSDAAVTYAKISASGWELKENSTVDFIAGTTTGSSNGVVGTGSISGVQNGDYIIIRLNIADTVANYKGMFTHYIIKVNFEVPTVTFNKNGGDTEASPATKTVISPATTIDVLPTPPTRTGYSFTGWNTAANGSGSAFTAATTVTANTTVYAQWSAYTLSISYASGGGTGSAPTSPTSAAYGTNVNMPANTYTNGAKSFAGWEVSGTGSKAGTHNAAASVAVSALSTAIDTGNANIALTATWSNAPIVKSSNANIRAVSGSGAAAKYGLYIGGMPGIDNGTPRNVATGFTSTTITLSGNNPTANPARNVVAIVEDTKVSKVEFGITSGNSGTTLNTSNNTPPSTWYTLTKNNEYTTPDTVDKRWTGPLTVAAPTESWIRAVYIRITAEDGTEQVYRYVQYISTTVTNNVTRGELTALSIGGVAVITGGNVQSGRSKGIASGWWNRTVAPDFEPGSVTLTAAQAASVAVTATVNNSAAGVNLSTARIPAADWPLLENSSVTFGTASSNGSATFTNVQNGDYILIRQNASTTDASYKALFCHVIIKVTVN